MVSLEVRAIISRQCLHCGKQFQAMQAEVNRGGGRFCSKACGTKAAHDRHAYGRPKVWLSCKECGTVFLVTASRALKGRAFCGLSCAASGSNNARWKGDQAGAQAGRLRAEKMYRKIGPCVRCGSERSERHHKDGNTLNNDPSNIEIVCRRCHMEEDGRLSQFALDRGLGFRSTLTSDTLGCEDDS